MELQTDNPFLMINDGEEGCIFIQKIIVLFIRNNDIIIDSLIAF